MRGFMIFASFCLLTSVPPTADAQAVKAAIDAGKWIAKSVGKAKPGTAANGATAKAAAGTEAAAARKSADAVPAAATHGPVSAVIQTGKVAGKGAGEYRKFCDANDQRYDSKACAAYKGARTTARMPRTSDKNKKKR